jgi:type IV pilus biogenesis protein CpaD/CtpE
MRCWGLVPLLLLAGAGCTPDYPMDVPGTWSIDRYGASNDANLRAMVANPHDLVAGQGSNTALGAEAAHPVAALFAGKRAELPQTNSTQVSLPTNSGASAGGGNAGQ